MKLMRIFPRINYISNLEVRDPYKQIGDSPEDLLVIEGGGDTTSSQDVRGFFLNTKLKTLGT